ncbi:CpG Hypothetical protein protein zinc finger C terminal domain [Nesidiocoris tenuis]|nr:CpG Hypothetical protein protein zinc finger C terminal domain [Nesidiocoris tenuis]
MMSREEIARQFELPERKSKIATLLKQDGKLYCICRSPDSSRFMIGCDLCEEWFHGDCIGISKRDSKNIKRYFCEKCQMDDPTLKTQFKSAKPSYEDDDDAFEVSLPKPPRPSKKEHRNSEPKMSKRYKSSSSKNIGCGECSGCTRTTNCGSCKPCKDARSKHKKAKECVMRNCKHKKASSHSTKRKADDSESDEEVLVGSAHKSGMQCYGPGCQYSALPNSKYCSVKCGIKLATNRIFHVLPQRLQDQSLSPSIAEEHDKKELEVIREKLAVARKLLQDLDRQHLSLDRIVERGKTMTADDEDCRPKNKRKEPEEDSSIYCVTCGHEIHISSAIKHMEKCFNKYESQASFGSIYKTRIEGNNMFCDFYNPANRTYCKRLRVLCPEHQKDPKIAPNEICGCPFVKNVFEETGEICREPKKSCQRHHCWEKLRRAEIDTERVRQWLKIDELLEQERQVKQKMSQRAGVLALMLHSTYDHDANKQEEEDRLNQMR